jgi:hypothetical protein
MATTINTGVTLVEQSQAQKEVTVNEGFARLDALINRGAIGKDWTYPPGNSADGDVYLVGTTAGGDWLGHDGEIAYYDQVWRFVIPQEGSLMWVSDQNILFVYKSGMWTVLVSIA